MRGLPRPHQSRRIEPLTPDPCDMLGKIGDAGNGLRIREQAEFRDLPINALIAGVMAEERERALAASVTGFLAKPLILETMVAMLRA